MSVVSALAPMITSLFGSDAESKKSAKYEEHLRVRCELAAERVAEAARAAKGNETQLREAVAAFEAAKDALHAFLTPAPSAIFGEVVSEDEMRAAIDRQRRRAEGAHAPEHHPIGQVR